MGGCCGKSEVKNEEEPYGPVGERKCRDIAFLILFLLFWGGMVAIAVLTYKDTNLNMYV
jgi:hypothetical protein